jgi:phosphoserine phosphatase RsbU/P
VEGSRVATGASRVGAALAALTLLILVLLDLAISDATIALAPLFALAPLIACAVLSAVRTAVFAAAAFVAAVGSGVWNGNADVPQQLVRLLARIHRSAAEASPCWLQLWPVA